MTLQGGETKTAETEAQQAAESQTQETQETSQASTTEKKEEEKKQEATQETKAESTDTETTETVELSAVKRDAEGNYVWIANPEDPKHSTVYKGKSLDELFGNVGKGINEKDSYINKLKSQGLMSGSVKGQTQTGEDETPVEYPEYGRVLDQTVRELRIDPQFLSYTKEQWRQYEVENGAVEAIEMKQAVNKVKQLTEARFAELNVKAINDSTLDEETEAVEGTLAEFGIAASDFEEKFDEVLKTVYGDKANFNSQGVRKNGRIVALATKEIKKMYEAKLKGQIEEEKDTETAKNRLQKSGIKVETTSRTKFTKPADKVYKKTEDVVKDLLAEYSKTVK